MSNAYNLNKLTNLISFLKKKEFTKESLKVIEIFNKHASMRIELPEEKQKEIRELFLKAKEKTNEIFSAEMKEKVMILLSSNDTFASGMMIMSSFGVDGYSLITHEYNGNIEVTLDKFEFLNKKLQRDAPLRSNREIISRIKRDILSDVKNDEDGSFMKQIYDAGGFAKMRSGLIPDVLTDNYLIEDSDISIEDYGPNMSKESLIAAKLQGSFLGYGMSINKIYDIESKTPGGNFMSPEKKKTLSFKIAFGINDDSIISEVGVHDTNRINFLTNLKENFPENYDYIDDENYKEEIRKFYSLENLLSRAEDAIRRADVLSSGVNQFTLYRPTGIVKISPNTTYKTFYGILDAHSFSFNTRYPRNENKYRENSRAFKDKLQMYRDNNFVIDVEITAQFFK